MNDWQKALTINGNRFEYKDLIAYSSDKIVSAQVHPWEKEIFRFIINWLSNSDHIIQHSSGTTGKPKTIKLLKASMMQSALNTCRFLNLNKGESVLLCMPVDYIAGKMMIIRSFVGDLQLFYVEPKSTPYIDPTLNFAFSAMVPLQIHNLLSCPSEIPVRKLLIGGAEINPELEKKIMQVSSEVYATYGMAETASHIAIRRINGTQPQNTYMALPGIHLYLDTRGCLIVDADYLPERVYTNDLVEFTGQGTFRWIGRYDNLINSGGIKIVPEEVESLILSKTLLHCIAIGIPDQKLGQKLVLVFEQDQTPDSFPTLSTDLENFLPRHWRPKDMIIVDHFPRNSSLKVDRKKLLKEITKHQ
jgi:O-succinylbenzoic acid--CoA ligase